MNINTRYVLHLREYINFYRSYQDMCRANLIQLMGGQGNTPTLPTRENLSERRDKLKEMYASRRKELEARQLKRRQHYLDMKNKIKENSKRQEMSPNFL